MYNPFENYLAAMATAQGIVPFSAQVGNPGMPLPQLGQNVDAWQIQALQAQACNQMLQAQQAQAQAQALQARQALQQQQQALFGFVNQPLMAQLPGIQMPLLEQPNVALASSSHHAAFTSRFPAPSSSMSRTQDFHMEQTCVAAPKEVLPVEQPSVASASSSHHAAFTSRFPAPSSSMSRTQDFHMEQTCVAAPKEVLPVEQPGVASASSSHHAAFKSRFPAPSSSMSRTQDFHMEQTCVAAPKEVLPAAKKSLSFQTHEIKPTKENKKQSAKSSERYSYPFMSFAEPAVVNKIIEEVPLHSVVSPKPAEDDSGCKPLEDIFEGGEAAAPPPVEQSSEEGTLSSVADLLASKFPETSSEDVSAAVIPSKKSLSLNKNKKEPKETLQDKEEEVEEEKLVTVVVSSEAESDDDDFMVSKESKRSNITHENVKQWLDVKKLGGGKEKAASTSRTPRKNLQTIGCDLPSPTVGIKRKQRNRTNPIRYSNEEDESAVDDVTAARPGKKDLPKKQKPAEENFDKLTRKELKERLIAALKAKEPENKADNGTD